MCVIVFAYLIWPVSALQIVSVLRGGYCGCSCSTSGLVDMLTRVTTIVCPSVCIYELARIRAPDCKYVEGGVFWLLLLLLEVGVG